MIYIFISRKIYVMILIISSVNISITKSISSYHREKRFLIFPRGNPTRHQFISGFGLPVDLISESMTVGYVFKAQYFLPYNTSQLYSAKFQKRATIEKVNTPMKSYDIKSNEEKENRLKIRDKENIGYTESIGDSIRWKLYHILGFILQQKFKTDGKQCILKYICEESKIPFSHESGLLSELLHILFTPSTTARDVNDYSYAEEIGKKNVDCKKVFPACKVPSLDSLIIN